MAPIPSAGRASGEAPPLDDLWSPAAPPPETRPRPQPKSRRPLALAALLAAASGAVAGAWLWNESRPEVLVPRLAAEYLDALRAGDIPRAYAMFSDAAKKACSEEEFRASRDGTPWTWSDLRVEHQEPGAVLLSYDLAAAGAPTRRDHVLFTLESDRWTRPYNWTLMQQVEKAFEQNDPSRGLAFAQNAAAINPRDPMAWGYLCEAAYYRKAAADAEKLCLKSLGLSRTYPSGLTPKSLYHLHAILADVQSGALDRPERALEQYAEMLGFPDISPVDQCTLLLARAQTYFRLARRAESAADLDRAGPLCADAQDQAFIRALRAKLSAP